MSHAPTAVVMVRPHRFRVNPETAADNAFQRDCGEDIAATAFAEVTAIAEGLERVGIRVHLFEDEGHLTPDSVFPNNWFSTHRSGALVTYPMRATNRRDERRDDIIAALDARYGVDRRIDLSAFERDGRYLEGTGSILFDRASRLAFACRSGRTDEDLLAHLCELLGYRPHVFDALDREGRAIYHSNVMMALGSGYALVVTEALRDVEERDRLLAALGDRDIVELTLSQMEGFAANALELHGKEMPLLAISARGAASLTGDQRRRIGRHARLLPFDVPTIERAGGSVRCMLAGVHLPRRVG